MGRPSIPTLDRFLSFVRKTELTPALEALGLKTGCWLWDGSHNEVGYARFRFLTQAGVNGLYAHRFSFEHFCEPLNPTLELDHICRIPGCVNWEHLRQVTHLENRQNRDLVCKRGHPLEGTNLVSNGSVKACRICVNLGQQRRYAARNGPQKGVINL